MKRLAGVIIAAVVLILASMLALVAGFAVGMDAVVSILVLQRGSTVRLFLLFGAVVILAAGAWWMATAVGLLRLRRWARISILVMGGLSLAASIYPLAVLTRFLLRQSELYWSAFVKGYVIAHIILSALPFAVGLWWLIYFTRPRVRAQFTAAAGPEFAAPALSPETIPPLPALPAVSPATAGAELPPSILVIAIYLLATAPFMLVFLLPFFSRFPTMIFGHVFSGPIFWRSCSAVAVVQLALGLGLLRRKNWARLGTIAFGGIQIANTLANALLPHSLENLIAALKIANPAFAQMNFPLSFFRVSMYFGLIFGVGLPAAAMYFLWTRRAAFLASAARRGA